MEYIYSFFNMHFSLTRQNEASVCVLVYISASDLNYLFYYSAKNTGVKFSLKFFFSMLGRVANSGSELASSMGQLCPLVIKKKIQN